MTQRYAHLHDDALKKASSVAGQLFGAVQNNLEDDLFQEEVSAKSKKTIRKQHLQQDHE